MAEPFVSFTGTVQAVTMTLPPEQRCHYIRDDELISLGQMDQDPVKDICLAAIGVFFGALVPGFDAFRRFGDTAHPMTKTDLLSFVLAVSSFRVLGITGYLWHQRAKHRTSMVQDIQQRPKVAVRLVHEQS